jgi:TPR repeat protein
MKKLIKHSSIISLSCFLYFLPTYAQAEPTKSTHLESIYEQMINSEETTTSRTIDLALEYEESPTPELALFWYLQLALQGNAEALFRIGTLHEFSLLSKESSKQHAQALVWYTLAAEQEHTEANIAIERVLRAEHEKLRSSQLEEQLEVFPSEPEQELVPLNAPLLANHTPNLLIWMAISFILACIVVLQFVRSYIRAQPTNQKNSKSSVNKLAQSTITQHAVLKKENQSLKKVNHDLINKLHVNNARLMFGYSPQEPIEKSSLKIRYKKLSKVFHPDNQGSNDSMQRLNSAYESLLASNSEII